MKAIILISDLIEDHNQTEKPYSDCKGCSICEEIERLSKQFGLWIGNEDAKRNVRENPLSKEEIKELLDEGYKYTEICRALNINRGTLMGKIKLWFPERKIYNKTEISVEEYIPLRDAGLKRREIAEKLDITRPRLDYLVKKWGKEGLL